MPDEKKRVLAQPSLVGQKVYLRPTTPTDISNMYLWSVLTEPQSQTCHPRLFRTADESVEAYKSRTITDTQQRFAVCRKKDKTPVGIVSFFGLNTLNRSAELGLLIDPDEHRQGYGSDALKVLVTYLFRYRGLNKVHAQTGGFNTATVALLEKLGFKRDAVLRDHYFWDGSFHPGYVYSLLLYELDW
ncbi:MAG: GNAT family protein [bacterium]